MSLLMPHAAILMPHAGVSSALACHTFHASVSLLEQIVDRRFQNLGNCWSTISKFMKLLIDNFEI